MSEQKNGVGPVVIGVVALGLVALVGVDQMRQHAKPAPSKPVVAEQAEPLVPDNGLPVFIEGDSVGVPTLRVAPPAHADTSGTLDQLPPGEVLTI